jgi:hypothetical protein
MFIKLTAIRITEYGEEVCGKIMFHKDQVAAVTGPMAFNFNPETGERFKNKTYRGNSIVHLTSGKVFPVQEKFTEIEAMLLGQCE